MAKMIDCFSPLEATTIQGVIAAGNDVMGRYLGRKTHQWTKALTPEEVALIKAHGKQILSNWEGNPTYAAYFSLQQGLLDGAQALEEGRWLGQPQGTAIYFSVDFDAQDHDLAAIGAYFQGVRKSLNGYYKVGVYGGYRVIEAIQADYYWQTAAWSNGQVSKKAHVYQRAFSQHIGALGVDLDTTTGDVGAWPLEIRYETIPAEFNGKKYPAIVVGTDTYVSWTMVRDGGAHITKAEVGDVEIDSKKPPQVVQDGDTYLVWTAVPGVKPTPMAGGGWTFEKEAPAPVTETKAPEQHPPEKTTESPLGLAYEAAKAKYGTVTKMVVAVKLPTGATELIINTEQIESKVAYYTTAYDADLRLKTNQEIHIAGYLFV